MHQYCHAPDVRDSLFSGVSGIDDYSSAVEDLEGFLDEFGPAISTVMHTECCFMLAMSYYYTGEYGPALDNFMKVIESSSYSADRGINPANLHAYAGICLLFTKSPRRH